MRLSRTLLAVLLILLLPFPALCSDVDARLEKLERQLQEYADSGQVPPVALMEELGRLMEEAQKEAAGDAPPPEEEGGYASVPFNGTVTISSSVDGAVRTPEGATLTLKETATATVRVTGTWEEKDEEGAVTDHTPLGTVDSSARGHWETKTSDGSITRDWTGSRQRSFGAKGNKAMDLRLDPARGRYLLHLPTGSLPVPVNEVVSGAGVSERRSYTGEVELAALPEKLDRGSERFYSPGASTITDGYTVTTYVIPLDGGPAGTFGGLRPGTELYDGFVQEGAKPLMLIKTVRVSWSLNLEGGGARLVFEPQGYDGWLPTAGVAAAGTPLLVKVRIKEPEGAKGVITIRLAEVSSQKGVCLNAPVEGRTDHDLSLAPAASKGVWVSPDGQEARTEEEVREVTVSVQPRDFGAFGRLEAEAKVRVKGKVEETRAVFEPLGTGWLALPRDDDGNHIADCWEEAMGGKGMDAAADADDQPRSRIPGDGLSAYEEYRGAYVKGAHTRFDPRQKDLFLHDPDGLAQGSDLARVTGLLLHYLDMLEMNITREPARVVNFNSGLHHLTDQHGIWVHQGAVPGGGWGMAGPGAGEEPNGPPRSAVPWVVIDAGEVRSDIARLAQDPRLVALLKNQGVKPDAAWVEAMARGGVGWITVHEVCHALSVEHHHEDSTVGHQASDSERTQGSRTCLMRYLEEEELTGVDELFNILVGNYPWPFMLCGPRGGLDCKGQVTVTDRGD